MALSILLVSSVFMASGYVLTGPLHKQFKLGYLKNILSLAAGFLLALVFLELIPETIEYFPGDAKIPLALILTGVLGCMILDQFLTPKLGFLEGLIPIDHHDHDHDHEHHHHLLAHGQACSTLGCLVICAFFDGIALSSSLLSGMQLGGLVFIGQLFHLLPEGLLAASVVLATGGKLKVARRASVATAIACLVGGLIPLFGFGLTNFYWLPLSCGILLYVSLGQLIPAATSHGTGIRWIVTGSVIFVGLDYVIETML
ncbi:MAG: ZIP family metal transporter [Xanthomonadaceae bacterium]|nr:ZIP family metal transporter [Xanthomonadaceae bacterium]